jgi:hypothetical protein
MKKSFLIILTLLSIPLLADDHDCTLVFDISKAHYKRIEAANISKDDVNVLLMLKDIEQAYSSTGISNKNKLTPATLYMISTTINVALEQIDLHGEKLDKKAQSSHRTGKTDSLRHFPV